MATLTLYPSGPPSGVDLGPGGAVVTNLGGGTVSYSDTADPFVAEGTIAASASATLTGTQFFRAPAGATIATKAVELGSAEERLVIAEAGLATLDAAAVKLAGTQTVTGAKTFSAAPTVKGNVYEQDSGGNPLVSLAPTGTGAGTYAGQILLHGAGFSGSATNRLWYIAIDVVAAVPYRDFVIGKVVSDATASDVDGIYISHGGAGPSTVGIGIAQPAASGSYHRAKINGASATDQAAGGVLQLTQGNGAPTGPILRATSTAGTDRWVLDPTNGSTWAVRVYGDASTSNPIYVIHDVTTGTKEQLRFTANGKIQWADPSTGTTDANAVVYRSAASIIQVGQNLNVGNLAGIGPAFSGANAGTTPTAQLDVATTGSVASNLYVRNSTQGAVQIVMAGSGFVGKVMTSNASSLQIGTNVTARITIGGTGNVSFQSANKPTLPAAATDAATTQALANALRDAMILYTLTA